MEIWKSVEGFEGLYEVSTLGRARSMPRKRVNKLRYLKLFDNDRKRLQVSLATNGKQKRLYIHRLVAMAFIPNPENKPEVNHIDGNPFNNQVSNLEWVTRVENMKHAHKTGLYKCDGDNSNHRRLNSSQVCEIRNLGSKNIRGVVIAKKFNVHPTTIYSILKNKNWSNI